MCGRVSLKKRNFEAVVDRLPEYLQDFTCFAYCVAWRRGQIASLTWADVDLNARDLNLRPLGYEGKVDSSCNHKDRLNPSHCRVFLSLSGGSYRWNCWCPSRKRAQHRIRPVLLLIGIPAKSSRICPQH
jgi:integrase